MTIAPIFDVVDARNALQHARDLGLGEAPKRRRSGVPKVADLIICTFDTRHDTFHVVYEDGSTQDLARTELADVGERQVVAWAIDGVRRGVEVVLDDGSMTLFSAEFPRYVHDEVYRNRIDARRGPMGRDLGERIAQHVRIERERLGWSVAELACRAEMAAPNVHRVESGKHVPSMPTIARLAEALGVPMARLLRVSTTIIGVPGDSGDP